MTLKGRPDGEAVLCTETATYALKTVETTNSLLLVEVSWVLSYRISLTGPERSVPQADGLLGADQAQPIMVAATADRHVDLTQTAPQLDRLSRTMQAS